MSSNEDAIYTGQVVSAYVANNSLPIAQIANVIGIVLQSFVQLREKNEPLESQAEALKPAVNVKKSVTHDYIICLEDGRKLKTLKRHLNSKYQMTPHEYRLKWDLPPDYPMVAPSYGETRSRLAKELGLGLGRSKK